MGRQSTRSSPLVLAVVIGVACLSQVATRQRATDADERIDIRVETTDAGELILVETVNIRAPVRRVRDAYTTSSGYTSWAAPRAEVDLRVGGSIRAHYDPNGRIGDAQTITIRVVNYVPQRMLTLQANISSNWPEILTEQAAQLYNVILFEPVSEDRTRLVSYGLGYRDSEEMRELMNFFMTANTQLYERLIAMLEGDENR